MKDDTRKSLLQYIVGIGWVVLMGALGLVCYRELLLALFKEATK